MTEEEPIKINTYIAQLEALLFVYGEPMKHEKIGTILSAYNNETLSRETIISICDELSTFLQNDTRGLLLIRDENTVQLNTKPVYAGLFESIVKDELTESLTPAALETLTIIAYIGPIPRSTIDYIRGVNSSFIIRALLVRGLIEKKPHPERGNTFIYASTHELMKHLGIARKEDLPNHEAFQEIANKFSIRKEASS